MDLPLWLQENSPALCNCGCSGLRKKEGFIQKTLKDIIRFLKDSVFSEEIAANQGWLQSLDPRIKLFSLFFLLLVINLLQHLTLLWGFYFILLIFSAISGLKPQMLIKRVWLVVPLFTGIMAFPALFNWVRPGDPLLTLITFQHAWHWGPFILPKTLFITQQGVRGDFLLISRVGISVTLAAILTLTTRWHDLLRALRSLFIPKIFVMTLEMSYRYIFVLLTVMEEMFLARKARDAGQSPISEQRRFVASTMASLFGKSQQMSEEVYASMTARGYTGEIRTLLRFRMNFSDLYISGIMLFLGLILYVGDKVLGG